jgi:hypothetical protein
MFRYVQNTRHFALLEKSHLSAMAQRAFTVDASSRQEPKNPAFRLASNRKRRVCQRLMLEICSEIVEKEKGPRTIFCLSSGFCSFVRAARRTGEVLA